MHVVYLLLWGFTLQGYSLESITQTVEFTEFRKFQSAHVGKASVYSMRTTGRAKCLFHCAGRQNCTSMYYNRYDGWCIEPASAIPVQGSSQHLGVFGWDLYMKKGLSYYIYVNESKTFEEATQNCESLGGYLACIGSDEEFSVIHQILPANVNPWIGANEWKTTDVYHWLDGTVLENDDHKWGTDQPDNYQGKENCVHIKNFGTKWALNDQNCDDRLESVCETIIT